jgi:penicillin-binding protein 1B
VWVGYDTDRELNLQGADSALPIWTEFMKRAIQVPEYSRTVEPSMPSGVVQVQIDPETGELATPRCPQAKTEYFLQGTQPGDFCHLHPLQPGQRSVPMPSFASVPPPTELEPAASPASPPTTAVVPIPPSEPVATPPPPKKKPGFFGRIFGVFGGGKDNSDQDPPDSR